MVEVVEANVSVRNQFRRSEDLIMVHCMERSLSLSSSRSFKTIDVNFKKQSAESDSVFQGSGHFNTFGILGSRK